MPIPSAPQQLDALIAQYQQNLDVLKAARSLLDAEPANGRIEPPQTAANRRKQRGDWAARKRAQRQRIADYLATFDLVTPRPLTAKHGTGPLVRGGYLKRKRNGYVRTPKPYAV
jgi:hypothetical protein